MNPTAIAIGLVFCAGGVWTTVSAGLVKRRCTIAAQARIVDIRVYARERRGNTRKERQYTPVLEYPDTNGQLVQAKGKTYSTSKRKYQIGDVMPIWFNPAKPIEHYTGQSNKNGIVVGIILIGLGIFLAAFNFFQ